MLNLKQPRLHANCSPVLHREDKHGGRQQRAQYGYWFAPLIATVHEQNQAKKG
jgi:hypothetical protein